MQRGFVDQGPHLDPGLQAVPHLDGPHTVDEGGNKVGGHALLHIDAVGAETGLAGHPHEFDRRRPFDRLAQISVLTHHEGSIAAQLQCDTLELLCRLGHQGLPDLRRARKRDLADLRLPYKHLREWARMLADHHIYDACWQARLMQDLRQCQGRQRGRRRWLQHDRTPGR